MNHLPMERPLSGFQSFIIMNNINECAHQSHQEKPHFVYTERMLKNSNPKGSYKSTVSFERNCQILSRLSVPLHVPISKAEVAQFPCICED